MRSVEVTGKTVDEAITSALLQLGASSDQVNIEILDEGGRGLLSFFHKSAKVRATMKEGEEQIVETAESKMAQMRQEAAAQAAAAQKSVAAAKEAVEEVKKEISEKAEEIAKPAAAPIQEAVQKAAEAVDFSAEEKTAKQPKEEKEEKPYNFEKYEATTSTGETVMIDDSIEQRIRQANAERDARGPRGKDSSSRSDERPKRGRNDRRGRKDFRSERNSDLFSDDDLPEKEVKVIEPKVYEIPADAEDVKVKVTEFLKDVLKAMGIDTNITAAFSEDGILEVNIEGEGMGVIIGKRGTTLDSLQYLATLVINKGRQDHVRMKLDTEGYRMRRQETLEKLAMNLAKKAKRTGRRVTLEPMNPYERRIIHSILQADRGVETYSEGEEPYRKVVIAPRRRR